MAHGNIANAIKLANGAGAKAAYTYSFASALPSTFDTGYAETAPLPAPAPPASTYTTAVGDFFDASTYLSAYAATAAARIALVAGTSVTLATSGPGDIQISGLNKTLYSTDPSKPAPVQAFTDYPGHPTRASDMYLLQGIKTASTEDKQVLFSHELNHALGLRDTWSTAGYSSNEDFGNFTIMSQNSNPNNGRYATELQLNDIASLQSIYGQSTYNDTDTSYSSFTDSEGERMFSIWDSGGSADTIDATSVAYNALIDLRPGYFSSIGGPAVEITRTGSLPTIDASKQGHLNISIAYGSYIENATGSSHDDFIIGNIFDNIIHGGGGNDVIFGDGLVSTYDTGEADYRQISKTDPSHIVAAPTGLADWVDDSTYQYDELYGGAGNDILVAGTGGGDLYGEAGNDILRGGINGAYMEGGADNDLLIQGATYSNMHGGAGNDIFVANGHSGMWGDAGNDMYYCMSDGTMDKFDPEDFFDIQSSDAGDSLYWNGYRLTGGTNMIVDKEEHGNTVSFWLGNVDSRGFIYNIDIEGSLNIIAPNGSHIIVHDFSNGDLGIDIGTPPQVGVDWIPTWHEDSQNWTYETSLPSSNLCDDGKEANFEELPGVAATLANYGPLAMPTTYFA